MRASRSSQFSPNHHLFLMGYADTTSPGQGLPSPAEPTRQVPSLATHPHTHPPICQQEDSWRWEVAGARHRVAPGRGKRLPGELQGMQIHSLQSDAELGEVRRWAPWQHQQPRGSALQHSSQEWLRSTPRVASATAELHSSKVM